MHFQVNKIHNWKGLGGLMKHCYTTCFFMLSILNYDLGIKRCCHEKCSFKMPLFHEKSDKLSGLCVSKYRLILADNCLCRQALILADNWVTLLMISENEKNQTFALKQSITSPTKVWVFILSLPFEFLANAGTLQICFCLQILSSRIKQ